MSCWREIQEAQYAFLKQQSTWDEKPNAIRLTEKLARSLYEDLTTPGTMSGAQLAASIGQHGLDGMIGMNVYGMKVRSVTAENTEAFNE
jgi:hypothetical protein